MMKNTLNLKPHSLKWSLLSGGAAEAQLLDAESCNELGGNKAKTPCFGELKDEDLFK